MKTRLINICALAASMTLTVISEAVAEVPKLVNYQGRLTAANGQPLTSGTYRVRFELFDKPDPSQSGGTSLIWGAAYNVVVVSGQFNVVLGAAGGTPVPNAAVDNIGFAFTGRDRYLQMTVLTNHTGTNILSPQVLLPRQQILSVPYALNIADGAVTAPKMAPDVAVWTNSGGTISYNDGPVGIGTSTPQSKLDVTGGGVFISQDSEEGGSLILHNPQKTGNAAGRWILYNMRGGYGNSFQIWNYPVSGGFSRFVIDDSGTTVLAPSGGNVGIGTYSPTAKLHVAGNASVDGDVLIAGRSPFQFDKFSLGTTSNRRTDWLGTEYVVAITGMRVLNADIASSQFTTRFTMHAYPYIDPDGYWYIRGHIPTTNNETWEIWAMAVSRKLSAVSRAYEIGN